MNAVLEPTSTLTVGTPVHFFPEPHDPLHMGAGASVRGQISHVWHDSCANITIDLVDGQQAIRSSVLVVTEGDGRSRPSAGGYAELFGQLAEHNPTGEAAQLRELVTSDPIEAEIQAKGLTAPRVTPEDIEAEIAKEYFFTGDDGVWGAFMKAGSDTPPVIHPSMNLLTICVLVLQNGFTAIGTSACASPENFNAEMGAKLARADAIEQIWPLKGYELRSRLHLERLLAEKRATAEAQALAPTFNTEGPDDWGMADNG